VSHIIFYFGIFCGVLALWFLAIFAIGLIATWINGRKGP
jgi:hypothetical protein